MTCCNALQVYIMLWKPCPQFKKIIIMLKLVGVLITTPSYLINLQSSSPVKWANAANGDTLVHYALEFRYKCPKLFVYFTGSIPEKNGDKIYNTSTVFNPSGELIAKYSKVSMIEELGSL